VADQGECLHARQWQIKGSVYMLGIGRSRVVFTCYAVADLGECLHARQWQIKGSVYMLGSGESRGVFTC